MVGAVETIVDRARVAWAVLQAALHSVGPPHPQLCLRLRVIYYIVHGEFYNCILASKVVADFSDQENRLYCQDMKCCHGKRA